MSSFKSNVYQSIEGRREMHDLYRRHLLTIQVPFREEMVDTSFGATHVVFYGNPQGKPILCFYNHMMDNPLSVRPLAHGMDLDKLLLIVPDPIGKVGFSDEGKGSIRSHEYGTWAAQLLTGLALPDVTVLAYSFGASIAYQLCLACLTKIRRLLLLMPAGLSPCSSSRLARLTKCAGKEELLLDDSAFIKVLEPIIPFPHEEMLEMFRMLLMHVKLGSFALNEIKKNDAAKITIPTGVIADEADYFFSGERVLKSAKRLFTYIEMSNMVSLGGHYGFFDESNDLSGFFSSLSEFLLRNDS